MFRKEQVTIITPNHVWQACYNECARMDLACYHVERGLGVTVGFVAVPPSSANTKHAPIVDRCATCNEFQSRNTQTRADMTSLTNLFLGVAVIKDAECNGEKR